MSLVSGLQKAYAGELGAIQAYKLHCRSSKNLAQRQNIEMIISEEHVHLYDLADMLNLLGARPSIIRNFVIESIGIMLGSLCFISGDRLANYGAMVLETVGKNKYEELSKLALEDGRPSMAKSLLEMSKAEEIHEKYFKTLLAQSRVNKDCP